MRSKTIRYRTRGKPPMMGEWLRSTRRPRWAFFILGVTRVGPYKIGGTVGFDPPIVYKLQVERRPANAPGPDDVVHPMFWDSRARKL